MTNAPTLKVLLHAMADPALHVNLLIAGTKWEEDPRFAAFLKAEEALGDLLWDMHLEAEEREGRLCLDCSNAAHDEATRP